MSRCNLFPHLRFLKLRFFGHEVAAAPSCGRQPADFNSYQRKAPKGRKCCRRFATLQSIMVFPWAYPHGYVLPSLRDSGNVKLQNLRFGLVLSDTVQLQNGRIGLRRNLQHLQLKTESRKLTSNAQLPTDDFRGFPQKSPDWSCKEFDEPLILPPLSTSL